MKYLLIKFLFCTAILFCSVHSFGQDSLSLSLQEQLKQIIDTSRAKVGIAITGLDFQANIKLNDNQQYPMQSVFKLPLALTVLNQVDKGRLSLQQVIHIPKKDLNMKTWSPLVKDFPNQDINVSLADLLAYTVSKSDNNGCDILFKLVGGPKTVNAYIKSFGVDYMKIAATEAEMRKRWNVQYSNWSRPTAMLQLLKLFYNESMLSKTSQQFMMHILTESKNSNDRLKKFLPSNTVVAHKTGTSDTNEKGMTAAANDVGIITLPNGRHYAIVVFVSDYYGAMSRGENIIAQISKLTWDAFAIKSSR